MKTRGVTKENEKCHRKKMLKGATLVKQLTASSTTAAITMNNTTNASVSTSSKPPKRKAATKSNKEAPEVKKKTIARKTAAGQCRLKKKQIIVPSVAVVSAPYAADPTRFIVSYQSRSAFDDLNDRRFHKTLQNVYGNDGDKEKENAKPVALLEDNSSAVFGKQPAEKQDFDGDHACKDGLLDLESVNEYDAASDLDTFQDLFHDDALEDNHFFHDLACLFGNEKLREISGMENKGNNGEYKEDWEQRATQIMATEQPLSDEEKWNNLLNPIEPLFKGMTKQEDEEMRGEILYTKGHVKSSKNIIERFYELMLNEPKLSLICAIVGDKTNNIEEQDITASHTIFLDRCSSIPTKDKYEAINAGMHCFLCGYKKLTGSNPDAKYGNEYQPSVVGKAMRVIVHWMNENEINFVISDFKKGMWHELSVDIYFYYQVHFTRRPE
jgi:hypothetical protein